MSIMAAQPATTPIPVQLSETEFTTGDEVDGIYANQFKRVLHSLTLATSYLLASASRSVARSRQARLPYSQARGPRPKEPQSRPLPARLQRGATPPEHPRRGVFPAPQREYRPLTLNLSRCWRQAPRPARPSPPRGHQYVPQYPQACPP